MRTLLFLGDSITDCFHNYDMDGLGEGYVRMIAEELGYGFGKVEVINKGFDGFTLSAINRLWEREADCLSCDVLTILIGINDLSVMKNTGSDIAFAIKEFKHKYNLLVRKIRQKFYGPILLMEPFVFPYPAEYILWEEDLKSISCEIEAVAKQNNLLYIPLWEQLLYAANETSYQRITTDGIHLTDLGHAVIANEWLKVYGALGLE